ncbi:MarR family transcriptional regulator [Actinoplanes sp. NPDC024001]|uniref:MarR family winged helix-turn-helix transcriptional regulator n=1 Tax=Actinoplanes sp. NPDC024001 TaxID=3154598 RepID=UPI0033E54DFF
MTDDSTAPRQIHQAFTQLIRWAHRGDVRLSLLGAAARTLSPNDITLLRTISRHGPVRASSLAAWQGVDKSTMTPQVRRLEERGLVARQEDPGDRRAALLTATDDGRRKLTEIDQVGEDLFRRALETWSDADQQTLAVLIRRLTDELAVVPQDGHTPH